MIRINLLAVERDRATKRRRASSRRPSASRSAPALILLVATVLGIGWWFWSLQHDVASQLDEDIAKRAKLETQQLRSVLAQVQKFETRKAQLQQRVTLIEQLRTRADRARCTSSTKSASVPDRLWLTDMTQKGDDFTLDGHDDVADRRCRTSSRNLEASTLVQEAGRHRRQPGGPRPEDRRHRSSSRSRRTSNDAVATGGTAGQGATPGKQDLKPERTFRYRRAES